MLPFEPKITVAAKEICPGIRTLPGVICVERALLDTDVTGSDVVIAATDDERINSHIAELCAIHKIPVNVVDDKEKCSFIFPALIKEGKFTAAVMTEGASPHIAAKAKERLKEEMPERIEEILDYLADLRETAKREIADEAARSRFLKRAADRCMELSRPLDEEEMRLLLRE
jgi:siroheme synthase-like protein